MDWCYTILPQLADKPGFHDSERGSGKKSLRQEVQPMVVIYHGILDKSFELAAICREATVDP